MDSVQAVHAGLTGLIQTELVDQCGAAKQTCFNHTPSTHTSPPELHTLAISRISLEGSHVGNTQKQIGLTWTVERWVTGTADPLERKLYGDAILFIYS